VSEPLNLQLRSPSGAALRHAFYPGTGAHPALLVTLPGDHYGMDGPLLYYPARELRRAGWSTLAVTFGYQSAGEPFSLGVLPDMVQETERAIRAAAAHSPPSRIALVGKSLGAALNVTLAVTMPELEAADLVYLTPPLDIPLFAPAFQETWQRSLVVIGTADRFYDPQVLAAMRAGSTFELLEVEGGDHSLNIPGDLAATLAALEQVVRRVVKFLRA